MSTYDNLYKNNNVSELANYLIERGKKLDFDYSNGLNVLNTSEPDDANRALVVEKISSVMCSELKLYRNDFKAQLLEFINYAKEEFSNGEPSEASKYGLVEIDIPDLLKEANELKLFSNPIQWNETRNIDYDLPYVELTVIKNPDSALDRYIKAMFTEDDLNNPTKYYELANSVLDPDECLFRSTDIAKAWFIASYIKMERSSELNITVAQVDRIIWKLETYLAKAIELYDKALSAEVLFLGTCKVNKYDVMVFKPVFDSMDNEVGIVDALYGLAVTEPKERAIGYNLKNNILMNKDKLSKVWDTFVIGCNYENPIIRRNRIIAIYTRSLEKVLKSLPEDLLSYCSFSGNIPSLKNEVEDILRKSELNDTLENIENIGIELVAGLLFNKTNYYKFIRLCEKYIATKEEANGVDDVLGYVLTDLITDFLLGQVKIFKIN